MKTKIILFCMLALSLTMLPARATTYDYPYLALESSDGVVLTVEVEGLTFTIGENTLTATSTDGSAYTFTLSNLSKMYFTDEATAIMPLSADSDEQVEVYNTLGQSVGSYRNATTAKAALRRGVYVVKSKSATFKISLP